MTDNPYRRAREMIESSCPPDVKAEIREVTDKWKDAMPDAEFNDGDFAFIRKRLTAIDGLQRSIERQARARAFWRGVLWGAIFAGGAVWYIVKGLWHG